MEFFGEQLRKAGYNYYGHERMYSGITGQELEVDVFIGTQQLLPPIGVVMTAGLCSSSREDVLVHVLLVVSSSPPPVFLDGCHFFRQCVLSAAAPHGVRQVPGASHGQH